MNFIWPQNFTFAGKSCPKGREIPGGAVAGRAALIADLLKSRGVSPGDRVAMWLTEGEDQIAAMFGCWAVGATFCVLPSFAGRSKTERSQTRVDTIWSVLKPKLLLIGSDTDLPDVLVGAVEVLELPSPNAEVDTTVDPNAFTAGRDPEDMAFVQFTSGSTGGAKGAVVRFGQLKANLDAIARRVSLTRSDRMVSWAPLYHDMGLMAVLLPLRCGADLVLMETELFVRRPSAWLEAISSYRGTVTTAPPTALKLLTRRKVQDIDLRSWRYAWIGGEMVFPSILQAFEDAYSPAGLASGVLQPTYGMAETVVGISCGFPGEAWSEKDGAVSCGPALPDIDLKIVDETGVAVAAGQQGFVQVRGPSVMRGYLGLDTFDENAWFDTGDLGFEHNDRLHITGRVKDVLKRGAESFPATVVEIVAEDALGLKTGRAAAFACPRPDLGKEEIVLLVESRNWDEDQARKVGAAVTRELGLQVDVIRNAKGGRLPRTSSGKLMRQKAAALYREG
ncbi:MAG: AMP-binding protein, partial [Pseudomonadota bacterium]